MVGRHNKIALITGAGSGIGRAVSIALLKGGYSVALCGRSIEPLRQTVATATANDDNSLCVSCDVGNVEHVKSMFAQIESKFKRIDLLFNNAGGNAPPVLILSAMAGGRRCELDRAFSVRPASDQVDENAVTFGWSNHQQWLDFSACAKTIFSALHRHKARDHWSHQINFFGLPRL